VIHRLWNLTGLRKTLRVSSSPLENPPGFPQIPQLRRRRAILGVHHFGAGPRLTSHVSRLTSHSSPSNLLTSNLLTF